QMLDRAQQEFVLEARLLPLDGPVYHERSVIDRMKRIKVPTYVYSGWSDMYSRGDLWLIDGLAARRRLLWVDASTHHGTGQGGGAQRDGALAERRDTRVGAAARPRLLPGVVRLRPDRRELDPDRQGGAGRIPPVRPARPTVRRATRADLHHAPAREAASPGGPERAAVLG